MMLHVFFAAKESGRSADMVKYGNVSNNLIRAVGTIDTAYV